MNQIDQTDRTDEINEANEIIRDLDNRSSMGRFGLTCFFAMDKMGQKGYTT